MSIRVSEDVGAGKLNIALKVGRIESVGPIAAVVANLSTLGNVVVGFFKEKAGTLVKSDKDTTRTGEDTGYDGDTSDLTFSGQVLNNLPIVPGSVTVVPEAGGTSVNCSDTAKDGNLYDSSGALCGRINYFTGALTLSYPAGKAPNTGNILANYVSQNSVLVKGGQKNFSIASGLPDDALVVYAAADHKDGARVKLEGAATWM